MSEVSRLLDPRGYQERKVIALSPRPSLEELKGPDPVLQQYQARLLQLLYRIYPH